jgi:hypothetical protein
MKRTAHPHLPRWLITGFAGVATTGGLALGQACTPVEVPVVEAADAAPDSSAAQEEQACEDQATAFCGRLYTCSPSALSQRFGTTQACRAIQKQACMLIFAAPSSGQTVAGLEACAAADATWDCNDFLSIQNPPPACETVAGALPNGAPCAVYQQCQSSYCSIALGSACGTCGPPPAPGSSCADTFCARGDSCGGTPPTCHHPSGSGLPCGLGATCIDGFNCVGSTMTAMGTCQQAPTTVGAPGVFNGLNCDTYAGVACNATTNTCETLRISPIGGPCGTIDDQAPTACALSICERGVCVAYPTSGEACQLGGISCLAPLECITEDGGTTGTCQLHGSVACN